MKKNLFLAALAVVALASCSDDNFVGNNSPDNVITTDTDAISFGSFSKGLTRADHVGADAAEMLHNKFIVGGYKGNGPTTMQKVFDNYIVQWTENSAATTESNTSDWEYVGITAEAPSSISGKQTIKYWDYNWNKYDFVAYSTGTATPTTGDPASGEVKVTAFTINGNAYAGPTYTLTGARTDLAKCYISDMVTAYKDATIDPKHKYQDEVKLTFRNLASKVRVALYETVPGYAVKDVRFYQNDGSAISTDISSNTDATLFTSGGSDNKNYFYTTGTYTVSFPTFGADKINETDYNKAHVAFSATGKETTQGFGTLNYVTSDENNLTASNGTIFLGRTLPTATYAGTASPWYTTVLPNENGTVLELRINYTLLATDGSGEEIKIHGAKAFVPAIFAAWKPNYAYTYVFKISDNTNGWTSTVENDPAGLYPITFDAVVVDSEEFTQSTITTVATPSITTYQKGHDVTKDEYLASTGDIYVQVMQNGTLVTDLNTIKTKLYTVTDRTGMTVTEADVMDALNIQASSDANTITGRNGWVLNKAAITVDGVTAIPGADGNDIILDASGKAAKFTPSAGTYAFVYDYTGGVPAVSKYYSAEILTAQPTGWPTGYYEDPDGHTAATTYANGTYYKEYTNLNHTIAVKIIKVK